MNLGAHYLTQCTFPDSQFKVGCISGAVSINRQVIYFWPVVSKALSYSTFHALYSILGTPSMRENVIDLGYEQGYGDFRNCCMVKNQGC